jgi:DNA/RNA-binding domain of Phe-tRNA-synthetase-like protein
MTHFFISDDWKQQYPGAYVGLLKLREARNVRTNTELAKARDTLAEKLRAEYGQLTRQELRALPEVSPFISHYKRYKKTYHVLLQLESVVFKGKSIPSVSGLVEAMFMAELEHHLLTAGHDIDDIAPPVGIYLGDGAHQYTGMNGKSLTTPEGDPYIADQTGILSNVIYGPADRASIKLHTTSVLYTVYTFPGVTIEKLLSHLESIYRYVVVFSPSAEIDQLQVLDAEGVEVQN